MPTVAPTGDPALVNGGTQFPSAFTGTGNLVNPAQATITSSPAPQQQQLMNSVDVSGWAANYESRIRTLQSERDKAVHERNQAIAAQAEMQAQLTSLQNQASTSITQAVGSAQSAIDQNKQLGARVQLLEGELMRAKIVLQKPHLADYVDFIPKTGNEQEVNEAIAKLEAINQQNAQRFQAQSQQLPPQNTGTLPLYPPGMAPANIAPVQFPQGQQQNQPNLANIYGQHQNMAPAFASGAIPGSSPAMMNPAGAASTADSINQMLTEARNSGNAETFERVLGQVTLLANNSIQQSLGSR